VSYKKVPRADSPAAHMVQAPAVRKQAEHAGQAFIEMLCPYTTRLVLPHLYAGFEGRRNWQVRLEQCAAAGHFCRTCLAALCENGRSVHHTSTSHKYKLGCICSGCHAAMWRNASPCTGCFDAAADIC